LNGITSSKLKSLKIRFTTHLEFSEVEDEYEYVRIVEATIPEICLFQFCPKTTNERV